MRPGSGVRGQPDGVPETGSFGPGALTKDPTAESCSFLERGRPKRAVEPIS